MTLLPKVISFNFIHTFNISYVILADNIRKLASQYYFGISTIIIYALSNK